MIKWTKEQINFLIDNYSKMSVAELSQIFGVNEESVKCKARKLGLRNVRYWTAEEDSILKEFYVIASREFLMNSLPRRTWVAIHLHAVALRLADRERGANYANITFLYLDRKFDKYQRHADYLLIKSTNKERNK